MEPRRPATPDGGHGDWLDLAAIVALGSATRAEREVLASHLPSCPVCQAALPALGATVAALPLALPDQEPPPGMRDRMEARLAAELTATAPYGNSWGRPTPVAPVAPPAPEPASTSASSPVTGPARRRSLSRLASLAAAAVLVAALLGGLVAWNVELRSQRDGRPRVQGLSLVTQQGAPGVSATSTYVAERDVLIVALHDAPTLGQDQVYQLWLVQGEAVIPFGIFDRASGESAVVADPSDYDAVVVTTEPAPFGSGVATTAPLLVAAIDPA